MNKTDLHEGTIHELVNEKSQCSSASFHILENLAAKEVRGDSGGQNNRIVSIYDRINKW